MHNPGLTMIANTPMPPYYAVIFTSIRSDVEEGYEEMSTLMETLVEKQEGFLGVESARSDIGITVSYWESLEAIQSWKMQADHQFAQKNGKSKWYEAYKVRIAKIERDYQF